MTEFLTSVWEILFATDPHANYAWVGAAIGAGASLLGGKKQQQAAAKESRLARAERAKQNKILEKQKDEYRAMEFTNPYANMENQYAENVYEDLTVNQQQAQFQAQQGAQQRANILGGLRGAAGTSGIAGLAQSMASQGQLQAQKISASMGQQEAINQQLRGKGALQVQAGAAAVDLQQRKGEEMVQQAESGRQATLLGMSQGQAAGANQAAMQAGMNEQAARASSSRMMTSAITGLAGAAADIDWDARTPGGIDMDPIPRIEPIPLVDLGSDPNLTPAVYPGPSDRKLKKNINLIGNSPSGLNIYSFEFKDSKYGKGKFQGVMSDEITQDAVVKVGDYDHVDYSKLDVEFKQI